MRAVWRRQTKRPPLTASFGPPQDICDWWWSQDWNCDQPTGHTGRHRDPVSGWWFFSDDPSDLDGASHPTWAEQRALADDILRGRDVEDDAYTCGLRDAVNALMFRETPSWLDAG